VLDPSDEEIADLLHLRLLLEPPSVASIAGRLTAEQTAGFRQIVKRAEAAARKRDVVAFLEADEQFHTGLIALLDNSLLTQTVRRLRHQMRPYLLRHLSTRPAELASFATDLKEVWSAVEAGDANRAGSATRAHLGAAHTNAEPPAPTPVGKSAT
jgi:DNA-binding GntR family transcriptional regulator